MLNDLQLNNILEDFDVAYWKINLLTREVTWSRHFESLIGPPEKQGKTLDYFLNEVLHKDYRYDFREHFEELLNRPEAFQPRTTP